MSRIAASAFKSLSNLGAPLKTIARKSRAIANKVEGVADNMGLQFGSPMTALGVGVPTAMFLGGLGTTLGSASKEEFTGFDRDLKLELARQRYQVSQNLKARRLQQAMAANMTRLAAANPQLYNQLLVGRTLPQGAVVIGGGQKTDFLESVAYQMATGGFENPTQSPDSPDVMQTLLNSY